MLREGLQRLPADAKAMAGDAAPKACRRMSGKPGPQGHAHTLNIFPILDQ